MNRRWVGRGSGWGGYQSRDLGGQRVALVLGEREHECRKDIRECLRGGMALMVTSLEERKRAHNLSVTGYSTK